MSKIPLYMTEIKCLLKILKKMRLPKVGLWRWVLVGQGPACTDLSTQTPPPGKDTHRQSLTSLTRKARLGRDKVSMFMSLEKGLEEFLRQLWCWCGETRRAEGRENSQWTLAKV